MEMHISDTLTKILQYSRDEAMRTGTYQIGPGHLFLGILRHSDNEACRLLEECGADLSECKSILDTKLLRKNSIPYGDEEKITFSRSAENTLNLTMLEASLSGDKEVGAGHLLLALSKSVGDECESILKIFGINYSLLAGILRKRKGNGPSELSTSCEEAEALKSEFISVIEMLNKENKLYS